MIALCAAGVVALLLLVPTAWPLGTVVALCGVAAWIGLDAWRRRGDRTGQGTRPLLVLFGVAVAATWWSPAPELSAPRLATLTLGIALAYRIGTWPDAERAVVATAQTLAGIGVLVALSGVLFVQFGNAKFPLVSGVLDAVRPAWLSRVAPFPVNPNGLGVAMVIACPITVAVWAEWRRMSDGSGGDVRLRALAAIGAGLSTLALVVSQSRSAWLGVAVGVATIAVVRSRVVRLVAAALLVVALVVAVRVGVPRSAVFVDENSEVAAAVGRVDLATRMELWHRALTMVAEAPMTGVGLGTFRWVVVTEAPLRWFPPDQDPAHAHNQFLQVAVDLGVPGLLAYLGVVWAAMSAGAVALRPGASWRWLAGATWVVQGGVLVFGMTDALALGAKVSVCWWATVGLALALRRAAEIGDSEG